MGMDVSAPNGAYFRANVWSWRPVWAITETVAPNIAKMVDYPDTNDGDGLNHVWTRELAIEMRAALDNGLIERILDDQKHHRESLPNESCKWCNGTGVRTDQVGVEAGMDIKGWCNGCDGNGHTPPWEASYRTNLEHMTQWVEFLEQADGFAIL